MRVTNGMLLTMSDDGDQCIKRGYVDFEGAKIASCGDMGKAPPYDGESLDAGGGYITPGLIDAHTHIGLCEEGMGWQGDDCNETTDPITPHLLASDGIYPFDTAIPKAVRAGVTSALVSPGSVNLIGGRICAIKLAGSTVDEMLIERVVAMKFAMGENPKKHYGQKKEQAPMTRMAVMAMLREAFEQAIRYRDKKAKGEDVYDQKHEALLPVLDGTIPAHFHAHRSDDIVSALSICKQYNLRGVIVHGTDSRAVIENVRLSGFPVITGPNFGALGKIENRAKSFETAAALHLNGILFAITTDHDVEALEYLTVFAALSVRAGLDEYEALKAITINPARIAGIDDRVGSIGPGKDADIVVWGGHPLDFRSKATAVFINGRQY